MKYQELNQALRALESNESILDNERIQCANLLAAIADKDMADDVSDRHMRIYQGITNSVSSAPPPLPYREPAVENQENPESENSLPALVSSDESSEHQQPASDLDSEYHQAKLWIDRSYEFSQRRNQRVLTVAHQRLLKRSVWKQPLESQKHALKELLIQEMASVPDTEAGLAVAYKQAVIELNRVLSHDDMRTWKRDTLFCDNPVSNHHQFLLLKENLAYTLMTRIEKINQDTQHWWVRLCGFFGVQIYNREHCQRKQIALRDCLLETDKATDLASLTQSIQQFRNNTEVQLQRRSWSIKMASRRFFQIPGVKKTATTEQLAKISHNPIML